MLGYFICKKTKKNYKDIFINIKFQIGFTKKLTNKVYTPYNHKFTSAYSTKNIFYIS